MLKTIQTNISGKSQGANWTKLRAATAVSINFHPLLPCLRALITPITAVAITIVERI